jgi:hypothetical protein
MPAARTASVAAAAMAIAGWPFCPLLSGGVAAAQPLGGGE